MSVIRPELVQAVSTSASVLVDDHTARELAHNVEERLRGLIMVRFSQRRLLSIYMRVLAQIAPAQSF